MSDGMMTAKVQDPGTVALTMPDPIDAILGAGSSPSPACNRPSG
jgi:hypothetical protein